MAITTLKLWMAPESNRLLSGPSSFAPAQNPVFYEGNTARIELHILAGAGVGKVPYEVPFPPGSSIKLAVGQVNAFPTSGTWQLMVDTVETADMPFNATPAQVAAALNALAVVQAAGGVTCAANGDGYTITWNTYGTKPDIGIGSDTLVPSSYESISLVQQGTQDNREVIYVELRQAPVALGVDWDPLPSPVMTVSEVTNWNGTTQTWRFTIEPAPKSGSYNLTIVGTTTKNYSLPYSSTAENITSKLVTDFPGSKAYKTGEAQFDIVFQEQVTLTADGNGLIGYLGYAGNVNFSTAEIHQFIGGLSSRQTTLEVAIESGGIPQTIIQVPCVVSSDVISNGVLVPLPLGTAMSEQVANARFVRRDLDQNPDAATLDVIWPNLGVDTLGSDVAGALNGADSPSAANPFATISDIPTVTQAEWGNITGTLSNQTDLASELNFLNTTKYDVSNPAGYIDGSYLLGYATESWVQGQGYLTTATLNDYARLDGANFTGICDFSSGLTSGYSIGFNNNGYLDASGVDQADGRRRIRFGQGTNAGFPGWGDLGFDGNNLVYGNNQNQFETVASRSWVTGQGYITSSALTPYITSATASATYQTIVGMSAYGAKASLNTWTAKQTFTQGSSAGLRIASPSVLDPTSFEDGDIFINNNGMLVYRDAGVSKFVATTAELSSYAPLSGATFSGQVNIGSMALNDPRTEIQTSSIGATISITKGASQQAVLSVGETFNNVPFLYISGSTGDATIHGGRFYSGGLFSGVEPYARIDGATFSGKANFTSVGGAAGLNVGIGGTSTSATTAGDLWIATGGANLNFRDGTGAWKVLAALSNGNVFTAVQAVNVNSTSTALRVTQLGTGRALVIEDGSTQNPDQDATVIDNNGSVGIGVNSATWTSTSKLEVVGNVKADTFSNGAGPTFAVTSTASHTGGTDTLDLLVTINGTSYRIGLRPA